MSELPLAIIKSGREKSLIRRHPWIYSGAIKQIMGDPAPGATIVVMDKNNVRFGSGAYSPSSQIAIRMWSFQPSENIDKTFFRTGIEKAVRAREIMADASGSHMQRMVFAESDNLPGLIVDRYEDYLVVQLLTAGSAAHGQLITNILQELFPEYNIFERSDDEVRKKEGLPLSKGVLAGKMPPDLLPVKEGEASYWIDMQHGHKTGFYLDQSDNRRQIKKFVAGQEVLNCFSYTGGFTVSALLAGAKKVTNIESSAPLLEILNQNLTLNRIDAERNENICGDVFQVLRQFRDTGSRKFDVIILDPPRFADSRRQISKAARGYKDINWLACRLIKPGGILITFSCSGAIRMDLFQKILADAARDADRPAQIIQHLAQAADHPVALHFPESGYLKGLICRIG